MTYRADDRTLTDAEADAAHAKVVAALRGTAGHHRPVTACRAARRVPTVPANSLTSIRFPGVNGGMTKADIVETVYEKVGGFSKKEAAEIVETVFDTIKETLERGEKIKISGFGNFVVRDKNARAGRNPQTGQEITISARRVLTFKPSQV